MKLGFSSDQPSRDGDSRRGHRFFAVRKTERAPVAPEPLKAAFEIGARYELVAEKLESAQRVVDELRQLAGLIGEIRGPILEEFRERRTEHASLQAALAAVESSRVRIEELEQANLELSTRALSAETAGADFEARAAGLDTLLRARDGEIEQLRLERAEHRARLSELDEAHASVLTRFSDMEAEAAALTARAELAEQARREADALAGRLGQERLLNEQEFGVLQKRLEQANLENAQLGGQLAQVDELLMSERRRVADLEAALLAAQNESTRAARLLEGRLEVQRAAQSSVEGRLEAALARIAKLDELNMGLTARLAEAALRATAAEDERAALVQSEERAQALARTCEQEAETLRREFLALEAARAAAVERADELARLAQSRDTAVKRAERQIAALKERLETGQADHARKRAVLDERLNKVQTQFERERAERAIVEGALETARRDRAAPERAGGEGHGTRETA